MGNHSTSIPWAALVPIVVLEVGFVAYCWTDLVRHPRVRRLPRWGWALICLVSVPIGGIVYLLAGRNEER